MYPNFSSFFRITVTAIIFIFFFQMSNAQSKGKIDFKYKVELVKVGEDNSQSYNIKIIILSGEGPFMVGIYENTKDNLTELDKKENVYDSVTLTISGKKDCVIYVRNNDTGIFKTIKY